MKHLYTLVAFIAIVGFFSFSANAQQTQTQSTEVVIEVTGIVYERGYPEVAGSLLLHDGLEIVGFCESLHVILIKVDRSIQPDDAEIIDALRSINAPFYIKEGATFSQVIDNCANYYTISSNDSNDPH